MYESMCKPADISTCTGCMQVHHLYITVQTQCNPQLTLFLKVQLQENCTPTLSSPLCYNQWTTELNHTSLIYILLNIFSWPETHCCDDHCHRWEPADCVPSSTEQCEGHLNHWPAMCLKFISIIKTILLTARRLKTTILVSREQDSIFLKTHNYISILNTFKNPTQCVNLTDAQSVVTFFICFFSFLLFSLPLLKFSLAVFSFVDTWQSWRTKDM